MSYFLGSCYNDKIKANILSLVLGLLVIFVYGSNETAWGSFLPTEYSDRGINKTTTGVIIAAFQASYLTGCLLFMAITSSKYRKALFCAGSVFSGTLLIIFGQFIAISFNRIFVSISVLCRCFIGFSASLSYCSLAAYFMAKFPKDTGKLFSFFSMSGSLGYICGPPTGSLLYKLGGYSLSFGVIGSAIIVITLVTSASLRLQSDYGQYIDLDCQKATENSEGLLLDSESNGNEPPVVVSLWDFLTDIGVICITLGVIGTSSTIGFVFLSVEPILEDRFHVKKDQQGFYFLSFTIMRAISAPFCGYFADKGHAGFIFIVFGSGFSAMSFLLLGVSGYFDLLNNLLFMEIALALVGIGSTGAFVTNVKLLRLIYEKRGNVQMEQIEAYISSMFSVSFVIGMVIGQVASGGCVLQFLGFYNSCLVESAFCALTGIPALIYLAKSRMIFSW